MTTFKTHTFASSEIVAAATLQQVQDSLDAICPLGAYLFAHMTPPGGGTLVNGAWLPCDGTAVSRSVYSKLFAVIGTTYGAGDGSTTFNLPDFQGRSPLCADVQGPTDSNLGSTDGVALASRRPKHSHTVNDAHTHATDSTGNSSSSDAHTHGGYNAPPSFTVNESGAASGPEGTPTGGNTGNNANGHTHSISGSTTSTATAVTAVGAAGLTDGPSYLVCCTVLVRAI
jgi:microcystin-dependent protein